MNKVTVAMLADNKRAPVDGCECRVCMFLRSTSGPVRPNTAEWRALLRKAGIKDGVIK